LLRQSYTGADEQRSTGQDYQLFFLFLPRTADSSA
jgi:hypothetical protein